MQSKKQKVPKNGSCTSRYSRSSVGCQYFFNIHGKYRKTTLVKTKQVHRYPCAPNCFNMLARLASLHYVFVCTNTTCRKRSFKSKKRIWSHSEGFYFMAFVMIFNFKTFIGTNNLCKSWKKLMFVLIDWIDVKTVCASYMCRSHGVARNIATPWIFPELYIFFQAFLLCRYIKSD